MMADRDDGDTLDKVAFGLHGLAIPAGVPMLEAIEKAVSSMPDAALVDLKSDGKGNITGSISLNLPMDSFEITIGPSATWYCDFHAAHHTGEAPDEQCRAAVRCSRCGEEMLAVATRTRSPVEFYWCTECERDVR